MKYTNRLQTRVEDTCRAVIDDEHPVPVAAVGGQEHLALDVSCEPGDDGLIFGAPGREGTDPHGHTHVAAVLACEQSLPATVTIVVRAADESAMTCEGVGHA